MRALILIAALLAVPAHAGSAFLHREVLTGPTKQCVYLHMGSTYIVTIHSWQLCPLRVEVPYAYRRMHAR